MIITKAYEEDRNIFLPEGWLDTEAAPALGEEIKITEGTGDILAHRIQKKFTVKAYGES